MMSPKLLGIAIIALATITCAGIWIFSPFQDRSSSAYQLWRNGRDANILHQKQMIERISAPTFQFTSLEAILVAPGKNYFSWWGHIVLRLVGSGTTLEDDVIVSFLADFADFPVNRWKAGFGGYEVLPKLLTYREAEDEYIRGESRPFRVYSIDARPEQLRSFLNTLRLWAQKPGTPGTYSFFEHNCVGLVSHLLIDSRVLDPAHGPYPIFPSKWVAFLVKLGVLKERG